MSRLLEAIEAVAAHPETAAAIWLVDSVERGMRTGDAIPRYAWGPLPPEVQVHDESAGTVTITRAGHPAFGHWPRTSASLQVALKAGELRARGYFDESMVMTPEKLEAAARIIRRRL